MTATIDASAIGRPVGPFRAGPGAPAARRYASPGRRRTAPNYLARRVMVAMVAAVTVLVATMVVVSALAGFGGEPAVASGAVPASRSASVHVAQPGDTLWSIAARFRGEVDHRRYVDALIELNGATSIEVGQAVRLP